MPDDYWVLREPPITLAELQSFISGRTDIAEQSPGYGRTGLDVLVKLGSVWLWTSETSDEIVPLSFAEGGVHIAAGGAEAASLAQALADAVGGVAHEG